MRWILEAWDGAHSARRGGVDVRAVTAWALFGLMDWDSLVTTLNGHYEPGGVRYSSYSAATDGARRPACGFGRRP